jgi:hypothetical protein
VDCLCLDEKCEGGTLSFCPPQKETDEYRGKTFFEVGWWQRAAIITVGRAISS